MGLQPERERVSNGYGGSGSPLVQDHESNLGVEGALLGKVLDGDRAPGSVNGVVTEATVRFDIGGPVGAVGDFEGTRVDETLSMAKLNSTYLYNT